MDISLEQRRKKTERVTITGIVVNLILSAAQLFGGIIGQSQALIADGLHSLSDLASDAMVLVAARHASIDADEDHPYGHARYETLAAIGLALLLIAVAIGICVDAYGRITSPVKPETPALFTLFIAAVVIFSKEMLYRITVRVADEIRSPLLEANAWHHRSDAISSIFVFIGIGGTYAGFPMLDIIAAVIVAIMIAKIGIDLALNSFRELVDTGLEAERIEEIRSAILDISEVQELHMLRSRRMGANALVDVHIQVAPRLSVSEGHHISESVETRLKENFDEVSDVTVHIDPENDESTASCKHLPARDSLLQSLHSIWQDDPVFSRINDVTLHYLHGKIDVTAVLPFDALEDIDKAGLVSQRFDDLCHQLPEIGDCHLLFGSTPSAD